ncbi:MAG: Zn-dependent oligopeptidase [Proteobacteria bacterium]|nr:Zn-dependent oligopeptidase [Pseudomonadota bacterium]
MRPKRFLRSYDTDVDRFYADNNSRIEEIRLLRDRVVGLKDPLAVEEILTLFGEIDIHFDAGTNLSGLLECVHPDEKMRNAAEVCRQEMSKLSSELELDRELYNVMAAIESKAPALDPQSRRFVEHSLRDFRRAGVDKDDPVRQRIKALNEELVTSGQEFNRNIRSDTRFITLTDPDDLAGLPMDYIDAHKKGEDNTIRITTDYPDLVPFMSYAKSGSHRKKLHFENQNRAFPDNIAVLEKILARRHELAKILGHQSWASYAAEDKMIRKAEEIARFIEEITELTAESSGQDLQMLLERKIKDDPKAESVEEWERAFYSELVRSETAGFDAQEIRPYLEYSRVKEGVLGVTQKLFDLEYRKVDEPTWHPSVETYDIFEDGDRIGRFHLDMHPRDGKYKHAAMFPVISGVVDVQLPEVALVCNFPDPRSASEAALLEHSDVVTFFHEFGHLLHHILAGFQRYVRFSGVATEWDFVEVPSQMLEEWAFNCEALRSFAVHFETGKPVPEEMVERLNRARRFGRCIGVRQQMYYAALSLTYHDQDLQGVDTTAVLKDVASKYSLYPYVEDTHMQASFGHLEGYSALYYTYMWSLVIARDLIDRFAGQMFDTETAVQFRQAVLEPGGSKDAIELIRDFLGREHNLDAYKNWLDEGDPQTTNPE